MKRVLLILNSTAGRGTAQNSLYDLLQALSLRGCLTTVCPVVPDRGLTGEKYMDEARDYDVIACIGGDGTLSHVINHYIALDYRMPIAYRPTGSTNDFSRSLGLPTELEQVADVIAGDQVFRYDIGQFNERYFNYVAAFGAFTDISYRTSQQFKNVAGHAAYILSALGDLPGNISTRCAMRVEHDGAVLEGEYLYGAVSNAKSVGGFTMPFAHNVKLDDGLFEVLLIKAPNSVFELNQIIGSLLAGNMSDPCIQLFQARELVFTSREPTTWTTDGEFGGEVTRAVIRNMAGRIPILVPGAGTP